MGLGPQGPALAPLKPLPHWSGEAELMLLGLGNAESLFIHSTSSQSICWTPTHRRTSGWGSLQQDIVGPSTICLPVWQLPLSTNTPLQSNKAKAKCTLSPLHLLQTASSAPSHQPMLCSQPCRPPASNTLPIPRRTSSACLLIPIPPATRLLLKSHKLGLGGSLPGSRCALPCETMGLNPCTTWEPHGQ